MNLLKVLSIIIKLALTLLMLMAGGNKLYPIDQASFDKIDSGKYAFTEFYQIPKEYATEFKQAIGATEVIAAILIWFTPVGSLVMAVVLTGATIFHLGIADGGHPIPAVAAGLAFLNFVLETFVIKAKKTKKQ